MCFLAIVGWNSADSKNRRKNSYTICQHEKEWKYFAYHYLLEEVAWTMSNFQPLNVLSIRGHSHQMKTDFKKIALNNAMDTTAPPHPSPNRKKSLKLKTKLTQNTQNVTS